jgi:uncharacterized repeat protein (TIGR03803 family)
MYSARTKLAAATISGVLTLAVLSALLLIAAHPAQAQTEPLFYNFTGGSDGGEPNSSLTADGAGNFYGTTSVGGAFGVGTVFELSPNGSGGWNETVLYSFTGGADGANPTYSYVMFDSVGNLYGTAYRGGMYGWGVVFILSPVDTGWTESVLYSFANVGDGAWPVNGLIMDPAGNLYGKTFYNKNTGFGTVFELSPSSGGWTEQVIYNNDNATAGYAGLTMDAAGNIFSASLETVFELSPNGNGSWTPTVLHTFMGGHDGIGLFGTPVLDQAGNLYGTTVEGGAGRRGTIYELSPVTKGKKKGTWKEKILYSFKGSTDGDKPWAGIVFDSTGNIYGTTAGGGTYSDGTAYELVAPVGTGSYQEKILWSFNGLDGSLPEASLILDSAGNLYGTTYLGGSGNNGVVFEVNPLGTATTTTTALMSSPNPSTLEESVTFTAVVTPPPPDGETVSFIKAKTVLGSGTLSGGYASFTDSALKVGTTTVTAVYTGDGSFLGSTSNAVEQVVKK